MSKYQVAFMQSFTFRRTRPEKYSSHPYIYICTQARTHTHTEHKCIECIVCDLLLNICSVCVGVSQP